MKFSESERQSFIAKVVEAEKIQREFVEEMTKGPYRITFSNKNVLVPTDQQRAYFRARKGVINHQWPSAWHEYICFAARVKYAKPIYPEVMRAFPRTSWGEIDWFHTDVERMMTLEQECVHRTEIFLGRVPSFDDDWKTQKSFTIDTLLNLTDPYEANIAFWIDHGVTKQRFQQWKQFCDLHKIETLEELEPYWSDPLVMSWMLSSHIKNPFFATACLHKQWSTNVPEHCRCRWIDQLPLVTAVSAVAAVKFVGDRRFVVPWMIVPNSFIAANDMFQHPSEMRTSIAAHHVVNTAVAYAFGKFVYHHPFLRYYTPALFVVAGFTHLVFIEPCLHRMLFS